MVVAVERCLCVTLPLSENCDTGEDMNGCGDHRRCGGVASWCVLAVPSRDQHLDQVRPERRKDHTIVFCPQLSFILSITFCTGNVVESMILMIVIPFATFVVVSIATAIAVVPQLKQAIVWRCGSGCSLISIRRPRGGARH